MYTEPIVSTVHHVGYLPQYYPILDGFVFHSENQFSSDEKPWSYAIIPHPALVYKEKDKVKLRKKYGLPKNKKIIGTMGFIYGTGKYLPFTVRSILDRIKEDEMLYLITPFWKGGDGGRYKQIMNVVEKSGKSKNFKIECDFTTDEESLNEKMQCCDLLYAWNTMPKNAPGSQSGSAADMYGARVKLIVKDIPHFEFIGNQDKVLKGRDNPDDFAEDIINALRTEDLEDIPDPEWLSWENKIKDYIDYFEEVGAF